MIDIDIIQKWNDAYRWRSTESDDILLIRNLRALLCDETKIAQVLSILDSVCHECWDNDYGCRCWDDS